MSSDGERVEATVSALAIASKRSPLVLAAALVCALVSSSRAHAYSVLAHEGLVDALWTPTMTSLIQKRFPGTTPEQMDRARAYAYGGSVIQDLGYYPFGNKFFSNLVHYVRSGDFVEALLREASDANEYAFALGALTHYAADNAGHPEATNRAVPMMYPKLQRRFGDRVTYAQAPKEHIIVEFSFDVAGTIGGEYLPVTYRRFIGFQVAKGVLERAFRDTYALEMKDVFTAEDLAISTYRFAVSQTIPALTRAAWRDRADDIKKRSPGIEQQAFIFAFTRTDYERAYGTDYQKPPPCGRFFGFLYRLVPKIGPLRALRFKAPPTRVEALFFASFADAKERLRQALASIAADRPTFRNTDFDTGRPTAHGEYSLADDTYADLLDRLAARSVSTIPPALAVNIEQFYAPVLLQPPPPGTKEGKRWKKTRSELDRLAAGAR
jgi:hypothetical protein